MTTHLALSNQKGGVGKTTNAINIAGSLAARDNEVLAADLDPQGYLTNSLGLREAYTADSPSLYDALIDPVEFEPHQFVRSHAEFDVLPSNIDMFRLEKDLIASGRQPLLRLDRFLERLDVYDYTVIDAPPSLGPINDNVLIATDELLIPVEAAETSILAIDHLLNQIESLERDYDLSLRERAILISNVNYPLDNEQREAIQWFEDTFDGRMRVYEIRKRAAIKRALNAGGSIYAEDAEETDMRHVYDGIAAYLDGGDPDE